MSVLFSNREGTNFYVMFVEQWFTEDLKYSLSQDKSRVINKDNFISSYDTSELFNGNLHQNTTTRVSMRGREGGVDVTNSHVTQSRHLRL